MGPAISIANFRSFGVALFAVAYFLAALLALKFASLPQAHTFVWPASGVAAATMLILPRGQHLLALTIICAGGLMAHLLVGTTSSAAIIFALAGAIECFAVSRIVSPTGDFQIGKPRTIARFLVASIPSALLSALIASRAVPVSINFLETWFLSSLLGLIVVTPLVVGCWGWWCEARHIEEHSRTNQVLLIILALASAVITFGQENYPLLFIPVACAASLAFFGGVFGALVSALVLTIVGAVMTALGYGPIQFVSGGAYAKSVFFQIYLFVSFLATLPIAFLLAEKTERKRDLRRRNELLSMAEELALVGHWKFEIGKNVVFWSDQVFRIHGLTPSALPVPMDKAVSFYHPDDRHVVEGALERAMLSGTGFEFAARIIRMDGEVRHVESRGTVDLVNGTPMSVFGVFKDVTEQTHTIWNLERAKRRAVDQAREAKLLSELDQLTGIANRRKFMKRLANDIEKARKVDGKLALIMLDVDYFKAINDTYGHVFGDVLLRDIAAVAEKAVRSRDLIGRLGGEEFGVILPGVSIKEASVVAERIRASIEVIQLEELHNLTVSLGVAEYREGADCEWLMQAADQALYEAKASGRNRFVCQV